MSQSAASKNQELKQLEEQLTELTLQGKTSQIKEVSQRYTLLKNQIDLETEITKLETEQNNNQQLAQESNQTPEFLDFIDQEQTILSQKISKLQTDLKRLLNPSDPLDKKNIILEIRAGAGGDESSLFAGELLRMYTRHAEKQSWKITILSANRIGLGGYKEVIAQIKGTQVYSQLKWESGVHRVQRVPETEKNGRVHTSTVTVAVLPEADKIDIQLKPEELRIDTMTASGNGGQSVNTTYSAIRITHLPTGLVVSCQDERSQSQNKERALKILETKLFALKQEEQQAQEAGNRSNQIGTGDRSEKIRTYNFPQDRITDHRINQNYKQINHILAGNLEPLIEDLQEAQRTKQPS